MSRYFTEDHEWIDVDGDIGTVGISEYAQSQLGDIVFVDVPEDGKALAKGDEAAVVEKAHRRPRFVEDCVREMIGGVVASFPHLGDDAYVSAHQENLESIHQHNVVAERFGKRVRVTEMPTLGRPLRSL